MKTLISILFYFLCLTAFAQENTVSTSEFVRIYDLEHKKIGKGHITGADENYLYLERKSNSYTIPYNRIGEIKTKRSTGHHFLLGSAGGGIVLGLANMATYDEHSISGPQNRGDAFVGGSLIGIAVGSIVGGVYSLFIPKEEFIIQGDREAWERFSKVTLQLNSK